MMLGMLAGHAGDVENDADDVVGLGVKYNTYISRENAVNYSILVARTENKNIQNKKQKKTQIKSRPAENWIR